MRRYRESTGAWRARLLAALTLLAGGWAAHAEDTNAPTGTPPNIVFILTDDQGWGDIGYSGHPHLKTPQLDAMAESGIRFNRFYSTSPSSAPARFAALTGVHPGRWGNDGPVALPEAFTTVAEALREAGYRTGLFGKWNLGLLDPAATTRDDDAELLAYMHHDPPSRHGFDRYFATAGSVPTFNPTIAPADWTKKGQTPGGTFADCYWQEDGRKVTENLAGENPRVIVDRVLPFLRTAAEAKTPFFAAVCFHTPHTPVVAGPEYRKRYAHLSEDAQHYLGAITAMDDQIGRLVAALGKLGVAENTLVLFCSDNGPKGKRDKPGNGTTAGLRGRKNTLYEGGIRVPALAVWPKVIEKEQISESPVSLIDLMPTLLQAAGLAWPETQPQDGESFLPLLRGEPWLRSAPLYFVFGYERALVTPTHKLYSYNEGRRWALYELSSDPHERSDISETQSVRLEQLQGLYEKMNATLFESERVPKSDPEI